MQMKSPALNNGSVVRLKGAIDLTTSPQLRRLLRSKACDCSPALLLDMSQVGRIDSSGAATLLEHYQNSRRYQGRIALAGLNAPAVSFLELLGLGGIFELFPDVEAARRVLLSEATLP